MSNECRDMSGIITDNMKQSPMFRGLQLHPETEDQIMDLETMPTYEPALAPTGAPSVEPTTPPADPGDPPQITEREHDEFGRVTLTRDPELNETGYTWELGGRLLLESPPGQRERDQRDEGQQHRHRHRDEESSAGLEGVGDP